LTSFDLKPALLESPLSVESKPELKNIRSRCKPNFPFPPATGSPLLP